MGPCGSTISDSAQLDVNTSDFQCDIRETILDWIHVSSLMSGACTINLDLLNAQGPGYDSTRSVELDEASATSIERGVAIWGCAPTLYSMENSVPIKFPHS